MKNIYTLDCPWFDKTFDSINELVDYVMVSGMDPNYEILRNGEPTGDFVIDLIE